VATAPCDYKFIHEDGRRECFLMFTCYKDTAQKDDLWYDCTSLAKSLYGEKFWDDSHFQSYGLSEEGNTSLTIFFTWERDTTIESVILRADRESSINKCTQTMMLINKADKTGFNKKAAFDLNADDCVSFITNIKFIDNGKN
jgi:hypothetical protein